MLQTSVLSILALFLYSVSASPTENIFGRSIGDKCKGIEGSGTCQKTSNCKGISYPQPFCPNDPDDVQCCVEIGCNVGSKTGFCRSVSNNGCAGGHFDPGNHCPGPQDIQCCLKDGSSAPPPSSGGDIGQRILAKAKTAAGLPYVWGGGSCKGPTGDGNGEIGYDCSGLVCWAVCQVTGRNLFAEGLRVTSSMYCASASRLKYKKIPLAQRKAGDAIFWGGKCNCNNPDSIHHVGLMMDSGERVWNAPNDQINKVKEMKIKDFGEAPCPMVIRFS